MVIHRRKSVKRALLPWISLGLGLGSMVSCSAAENGPSSPVVTAPETHRAIPASSGAKLPYSATPTAVASASAKPPAGPQDVQALPCGVRHEHALEAPPWRALSQHVPDRTCSGESECGDGFCDRGRCAPIWEDLYGQRCTMTCQCGPFLCLEGRCMSCLHHTECVENGNTCAVYHPTSAVSSGCGVLGMHSTHMPPEPVRPPPPATL